MFYLNDIVLYAGLVYRAVLVDGLFIHHILQNEKRANQAVSKKDYKEKWESLS